MKSTTSSFGRSGRAPRRLATGVASIGEAAKVLKSKGRKWACVSIQEFRRSRLIQDQLGSDDAHQIDFLKIGQRREWGAWALLNKNLLIYAPRTNLRKESEKLRSISTMYLALMAIVGVAFFYNFSSESVYIVFILSV